MCYEIIQNIGEHFPEEKYFTNYTNFSTLVNSYSDAVWESPYYGNTYIFADAVKLDFFNKKDSYIKPLSSSTAPTATDLDNFKKQVNNDSLVFKMTLNTKTFLFTGDIGMTAANEIRIDAPHG